MNLKIFAVYDSKVGAFEKPFFMRSTAEALRAWGSIVNDNDSQICKHPEDFTLFEIGEFDSQTGRLSVLAANVSISLALDMKASQTELKLAGKA